jgi:hypothetical protein
MEAATTIRVAALELATAAFESWRPNIESVVDDVRYCLDSVMSEISKMNIYWDQAM